MTLSKCPGMSCQTFFFAVVISQSEEMRTLSLSGHVGFDSLPDQLVSKSVCQGFSFNILCVGEEKVLLSFCRPGM